MKKNNLSPIRTAFYALLFLFIYISVNAQKLPSEQKESVYAPGNINIDGKATEWENKFKAYNASNAIFYTLSNDDSNLYLIVYAPEYINLDKIIYGGITLTINDLNDKNKLNSSSITYPVADLQKTMPVARTAYEYHFNLKNNIAANKGKIDSLEALINTRSENTFKEIRLKGVKGISSPDISIYNTDGIKVKMLFDNKIALTYELCIPLKYLNLVISTNDQTAIKYNIMLNGRMTANANSGAPNSPTSINGGGNYIDSPTDFGGEYTLAKKQ